MTKRKFEVHAEDKNGDVWIVGTDRKDTAESLADQFRKDGHKNVRIIEN